MSQTIRKSSETEVIPDRSQTAFITQRMTRTVSLLCVLLLAGIGAVRIIATYSVFSQTYDEPAHIAAGMQWLDKGLYTYETLHPPLARVAVAFLPFLDGLRSMGQNDTWQEMWRDGNEILHARGSYYWNLALARLGVLPFFLLATGVVWGWSRRLFGNTTALLATILFTTLPPILAHSGLATTDMALTATFAAALLAFTCWLDKPTFMRSLLLGLAGALAILTKLSALLFLPACGIALLALRWVVGRGTTKTTVTYPGRWRTVGPIILVAVLTIWSGYRFSVSPLTTAEKRPHVIVDKLVGADGFLHDLAYTLIEAPIIPASELLNGIQQVKAKNARGHTFYLLGKPRENGEWYFFPVALAVKSPLPFLILTFIGFFSLVRLGWYRRIWSPLTPAVGAIVLLLVCLPSNINIGVRHILPIYPLLAIVAGYGATKFWTVGWPRLIGPSTVSVLVVWHLVSSFQTHPDYLAYFNELANDKPGWFLVDSDLDWGQDLKRLATTLRAWGIEEIAIAYFGTADLSRHSLPTIRKLTANQATTGWIAISEFILRRHHGDYAWLDAHEPVALVGRSIRLYYLP
ncbi:MAG: glycosyltransferase family 39 protein [Candidatus Poribacteria bacterium]|nr:glycosyltransferase family 39 protein [Candidatus Poribacteria bacterium]